MTFFHCDRIYFVFLNLQHKATPPSKNHIPRLKVPPSLKLYDNNLYFVYPYVCCCSNTIQLASDYATKEEVPCQSINM
jgi:hypothetical protein